MPSRRAISGSSKARTPATSAGVSSRSASTRTKRPGCSDCADRTSPRTPQAARSSAGRTIRARGPGPFSSEARTAWTKASASAVSRWTSATWGTAGRRRTPTTPGPAASAPVRLCAAERKSWCQVSGGAPLPPFRPGAGVQVRRNRESSAGGASKRSVARRRRDSDSAEASRRPAGSVRVTVTASVPARVSRTRASAAPRTPTATPRQEKGRRASAPGPANSGWAAAWSAASSRAGWIPYASAVACSACGSRTSAKRSSPWRHAVRRPRKTGP